tara:strand:+ start:63 stop:401 length:339 start_codon:yes stop_codon:yes gene_type:complete
MSIFEIAWSLVKAEPPNYIEDEPHDEDAYIVGPPITCPDCGDTDASMIREPSSDGGYLSLACPACGAGGPRPELFDPRLGDMGLYADGTALWEHIVEGARDPETEEIPKRVD